MQARSAAFAFTPSISLGTLGAAIAADPLFLGYLLGPDAVGNRGGADLDIPFGHDVRSSLRLATVCQKLRQHIYGSLRLVRVSELCYYVGFHCANKRGEAGLRARRRFLSRLQGLKSLHLSVSHAADISAINATHLRHLSLSCEQTIADAALLKLQQCNFALEVLLFNQAPASVTDDGFGTCLRKYRETLLWLKYSAKVDLDKQDLEQESDCPISDAGCLHATADGNFKNLHRICIWFVSQVTGRGVRALCAAGRMQDLELGCCHNVNADVLFAPAPAPMFSCLKRLMLFVLNSFDDGCMTTISKACPLLEEFTVHRPKKYDITDAGLTSIASCAQLRTLRLTRISAHKLLINSSLTALSKGCPSLSWLEIGTGDGDDDRGLDQNWEPCTVTAAKLAACFKNRWMRMQLFSVTQRWRIGDEAVQKVLADAGFSPGKHPDSCTMDRAFGKSSFVPFGAARPRTEWFVFKRGVANGEHFRTRA